MPATRTPIALALAMLLLGCPKSAPVPATAAEVLPEPVPAATGEFLPTPYSAEQIRGSWRTGLVVVWRVVAEGNTTWMRWRVLEDTDADVTIRFCDTDETGVPETNCSEAKDTWEALRAHALFPRAHATMAEGNLDTPFGTHATTNYVVTEPDGSIRRFWFGVDTPGAPLKHTAEVGGAEVMVMEMMRRDAP